MNTSRSILDSHKKRVRKFLEEHWQTLVIHKLTHNVPITKGELGELERMPFEQSELADREQFTRAFGEKPLGALVRSVLGLDVQAARAVFATFLQTPGLNTAQIRFIDLIIRSLMVNGWIDPAQLFEPPFTGVYTGGLSVFDDTMASTVVHLLEGMQRNAEAE